MKYELNDKPGFTHVDVQVAVVDCLLSLCGDYGNYRVATSLHECGRTDILFAKIVRDHGDSDDCTGVVGTSVTADHWAGIGIVAIGILSTVSSGIPAVYTGIMVGGLVLTVLAYSGLLGKLQFVFTPRIVTVILILIAFTLTPVILKLVLGDAIHALFNLFSRW